MKGQDLRTKLLIWRIKHIPNRNIILMAAGLTGIMSGVAALVLKTSVHYIKHFLTKNADISYANIWYFAYPLIGLLITVAISEYILKERQGHGIIKILYAISKKSAYLERAKVWGTMLTSAITVGFGGSVGVEAPVVLAGSAIGSNFARFTHFSYANRKLLIGCGAAGAISAIFHAPVGGVIFAVEVLLTEASISAFIPLLIASVAGSMVSKVFGMDDILLSFKLKDDFSPSDFPFFLVLGVLTALVATYFTRTSYFVEKLIDKIKQPFSKAILGGVLLGLITFIFPPIYGEGFDLVKDILSGHENVMLHNSLFFDKIDNVAFILIFIAATILFKAIAASITIGSGGNGGFFGPSLFIGALTGFGFATLLNSLGIADVSPSIYALVGMCGVLASMLHAPLTAIFLIAEVTNGYTLFVPLMYVSAISYTFVKLFEKHSLYTKQLIAKGDLIHHDKDKQVINMIDGKKLIEKDLKTINSEAHLRELVELVKVSKRNIFPVINDDGIFLGMITLDDVRKIMFDEQKQDEILIKDIMHAPPEFIDMKDSMDDVMAKFENSGAWNLPVLKEGKYIGFLSKSRIFYSYRQKLKRGQKSEN